MATVDFVNARNIQKMMEDEKKLVLNDEYYIAIPKNVKMCVIVVGWRKRMYFCVAEIRGA